MRKITLILYVSAFFISTLLFGAFAKGESRNLFNSKFSSYTPELNLSSYFSMDHENYLWVNSLLAEIDAPVVSNQEFCGNATIADLVVEGEVGATFNWFSSATSTTILGSTTVLTSTTYYVSQTVGVDTSERVSVQVTIKTVPDAPAANAQSVCDGLLISDLEVSGASGGTILWYATASSTTALNPTTVLTDGTYFVSQIVDGCESGRTGVSVIVKDIPAAPTASAQTFCGEAVVSDLVATPIAGGTLVWYNSSTSNTPLNNTEALVSGTYYVAQMVDGCESDRVSVIVTKKDLPAIPTVDSHVFCEESTVADLVAEGEEGAIFNWYDSEDSEESLGATIVLSSGVYYVSQVVDGCESERVAFYVKILTENTVGTGTSFQRFPLGNWFGFERSAALYTSAEVGLSGVLSSVGWEANTAGQGSRPVKIYLKETSLTDLTTGISWANITTDAILVYDSNVTPTVGWNVFSLTASFTYTGLNNLLVLVEANGGGNGTTGSDGNRIRYSTATGKHRTWVQDNSVPTGTGDMSSNRPNIKFNFGGAADQVACLPPSNLISDEVTTNTISVSWTANENVPDSASYGLYISTSSDPIGFCTLPLELTENTDFDFDELEPNTDYYIWVRGDCHEEGGYTTWLGPIKVRTLCEATVVFPFVETFSTTSETKECWTVIDVNGDGDMWDMNYESNPFVGDRVAMLYTDGNQGNNNDWLISPKLNLSSTAMAKRLKFHYRVQSAGEPNDFKVMASTTGTNPADFTIELMPLTVVNNINYLEKVINLVDVNGVPLTGNVHIAFHVPPGGLDGWRLYIDNVIVDEYSATCPEPTNLQVTDLGFDSMELSWTAGGGESAWEVLVLPAGSVAPNFTTTGYENATTNPYTVTDLDPSTAYDIYIRAKCSTTDKSAWASMLNVLTSQIPATLPYNEGFEGEDNWSYSSNTVNQWVIGSAVSNSGNKSLYVSNDGGITHAYTSNNAVAHAYRDIAVPGDINEMYLGFDWLCLGEGFTGTPWDYFRVWFVPVDFQPTPGIQITTASGGIQLGKPVYNNSLVFLSENIVFDATAYAGQTMRLIFEWKNDGGVFQPPAAIDNVKVAKVTCSAPSNVVASGVTENSVSVSWTAPNVGGGNYDLYMSTTDTPPTDTTPPTATTTNTSYTFPNLAVSTNYYIWVRTNCGTVNGTSFWVKIIVKTSQVPATLTYSEGFEGTNNWEIMGTGVNQWVVGTAVNNGGMNSLYVSKDGGTTNTYDTSAGSISFAYRDFLVEDVSGELEISFDWLCMGETSTWSPDKFDYFNVWVVPSSYNPTPGVLIENTIHNGTKIVHQFAGEDEFLTEISVLGISGLPAIYNNGYFRIIFEWNNNTWGGTQPPAAIDNLIIKKITCPAVINLESEIIVNPENQDDVVVKLTWTPTGTETQWEVFIVEILENQDDEVPDENSVGIIVNAPTYIFDGQNNDGGADRFYKFYVRPICDEDDIGRWSDPGLISFVPPPGCAKIDAEMEIHDIDELTPNDNGDYVICQDDPVSLKLSATYYDIPAATSYKVDPIEYRPPFPFVGGTQMPITADDDYTASFDLPFEFCFFQNKYDFCRVGDNGVITFGMPYTTTYGEYCPWDLTGLQIPNVNFPIRNAIYGIYQDMLTTNNPGPKSQINYGVIGKYPCRTFVVNFNDVPAFQCAGEEFRTTTQIVLYEITNIIEVYVKKRTACMTWPNGTNAGQGVLGIQNAAGTVAYTPPGRNTGAWSTVEEAWRFSPNGETTADFYWEKDGEFYSNETSIEVSINESVRYTAKASYEICGEVLSLTKEFNFLKENFKINGIEDLIDCSRKPGELNVFELRTNDSLVLGDLDPEKYTIEYFFDESDAHNGENALPDVFETLVGGTAYVKLTNLTTGCYKLRPFRLVISDPVTVTKVEDAWVCESFEFPTLKPGEAFYTKPYGEGVKYVAGDVFSVLGKHTFYVYRVNELGCYGQSIFDLEIVEAPVADIIENQLLKCETYFLPSPSVNNKYFTEPGGQGIEMKPGSEIRKPTTIYIYAKIVGSTGLACVDESSFKVDFEDCALPKGISPNGDGLNDSFDLTGYGILDIKIYNRYGTEVFSYGETYTNEWHGQDKAGQALPDGTYYYVAIANGKVRTGWVQINR